MKWEKFIFKSAQNQGITISQITHFFLFIAFLKVKTTEILCLRTTKARRETGQAGPTSMPTRAENFCYYFSKFQNKTFLCWIFSETAK